MVNSTTVAMIIILLILIISAIYAWYASKNKKYPFTEYTKSNTEKDHLYAFGGIQRKLTSDEVIRWQNSVSS
jgi:hypothetical protein